MESRTITYSLRFVVPDLNSFALSGTTRISCHQFSRKIHISRRLELNICSLRIYLPLRVNCILHLLGRFHIFKYSSLVQMGVTRSDSGRWEEAWGLFSLSRWHFMCSGIMISAIHFAGRIDLTSLHFQVTGCICHSVWDWFTTVKRYGLLLWDFMSAELSFKKLLKSILSLCRRRF